MTKKIFLFLFIIPVYLILGRMAISSYYLYQGYQVLLKRNFHLSQKLLTQSLSIFPYRKTFFYLGNVYFFQKKYGKAYEVYKKGFYLNNGPAYYYNYLYLLKEMRKREELVSKLKLAIKRYPLYFKFYLLYFYAGIELPVKEWKRLLKRVVFLWDLRKYNRELDSPQNRTLVKEIKLAFSKKITYLEKKGER